jgi:aspartate/methionine/tyrosine aminotransferase
VIRWSRRLWWNEPENALAKALRARREPFVDLTESNPTRAGLSPAIDPGVLCDARALRYEPHAKGLRAAREAVAAYYAESRGAAVDPERIVLTASTSEAYAFVFKLLCDPGDEVLVPEPSYPLFAYLTSLEGVSIAPYPLRWDGEWHLDAEALARAATPRTRAVLAVSPGNPTGAYLKIDELERLAKLCAERGCALVSDEVFADFPRKPDARRVATTASHASALTFTLSGLSKLCGLPQLKLGWCVVSGPPGEADEATARLELIADQYLSVGAPVQHAAPALLASRHDFQRRVLDRVRANLLALARARPAAAAWDVLPAEAGWSAILSVPAARGEEELALSLLREGVLVHPGYFFDFPRGSHLVVSLLAPEGDFARAAAGLARVLGGTG